MPTHIAIEAARVAAQDILDNRLDFVHDIQPSIDAIGASASNEWDATRTRILPVRAAFSQAFTSQTIAMISESAPIENSSHELSEAPGMVAYQRYLDHTSGLEQMACETILPDLLATEGTFVRARKYFGDQVGMLDDYTRSHPQEIRARGKVPAITLDEGMTLEDALILPFTNNSKSTTLGVLIGEMLRMRLHEDVLPDAAELKERLQVQVELMADSSKLSGQPFHYAFGGREAAIRSYKEFRRGEVQVSGIPAAAWPHVLQGYLEQPGPLPGDTILLGQALRGEFPTDKITCPSTLGHCAAQLPLQPHENPTRPGSQTEQARSWFAAHGVELGDNASFRVTDYQLLRCIDVASYTIFQNKECRAAFESMAADIQQYAPEMGEQ